MRFGQVRATDTPEEVMHTLLSLSKSAILRKVALLHALAPYVQWSAATAKSAIRMFFHASLTPQ